MYAFSNYLKPSNKKYSIDLESVDEDVPRKDSFKLANPHITFDNDPAVSTIPLAKEQTIDPYEPKEHDLFKVKPLSYREFDDLLIGFSPEPIKTPSLANNDTKAMFGVVSGSELALSNFETEHGTSNRLNTLLRQKETGQSMDEIKLSDAQLGQAYDNAYQNGLDSFMKEYNALQPTTDVDELKAREEGKTKTIKALKQMTEEQKTKAMIRSKRFMPKKTVIQPVVPVSKPKLISNRKRGEAPLRLQVLQEPVQGFSDNSKTTPLSESPVPARKSTPSSKSTQGSNVKSLIQSFDKLTPAPKSNAKSPSSTPKPRSLSSVFSDIADGPPFEPSLPSLPPPEALELMNLKQLREIGKSQKIDKYYSLRKPELLFVLSVKKLPQTGPSSPVDESRTDSTPRKLFRNPRMPSSGGKLTKKYKVGKEFTTVANIHA